MSFASDFVQTNPPYYVDVVKLANGVVDYTLLFNEQSDALYWMRKIRMRKDQAAILHDTNGVYIGGSRLPQAPIPHNNC